MIKVIVAIKKNPELSVADFQNHWLNQHAALVKNNPAAQRYIRKYIQCHTLPSEYDASGNAAYDGTAELWFDSVEDKEKFFSDPDYVREIQPDERRFADMENTRFFVTEERSII
ncbi:EthD family reductase [Marinobacter panjinensis]|uniref:EthD family reductase n=1 Tax=Marinobacter panjinensis TaxID=2576384 RepID=A0A4U6QU96_9GAMM|nr:EthD domain-containing protein [Marinobacter panjinensis]MCR8915021.1 EthD domain-containing protein [Marinobacter panjinensis]TKV64259.1 EthD family reductase [Marinobacter panjinensis]